MFYNPKNGLVYEDLETAVEHLCVNHRRCNTCPFNVIVPLGQDCKEYYREKLRAGEYIYPDMIAENACFELLTYNDEIEVSYDELNGLLGGVLP